MSVRPISIHQAVEILHAFGLEDLNKKRVCNQIDRGKLPCTVVARKRRIREDYLRHQITEWIEAAS